MEGSHIQLFICGSRAAALLPVWSVRGIISNDLLRPGDPFLELQVVQRRKGWPSWKSLSDSASVASTDVQKRTEALLFFLFCFFLFPFEMTAST